MRIGLIFFILCLVACSNRTTLQPFSSDGCSLFPNQNALTRADWCECCFLHDVAYWRGGTAQQRASADEALRQCVEAKTGDEALANLMYEGVRLGGSPYFYSWYRWGYGWPFKRKYKPLSAADWAQVESRWMAFLTSDQALECRVDDVDPSVL